MANLPTEISLGKKDDFDFDFYAANNQDVTIAYDCCPDELWKHFVNFGQFEDRKFRFLSFDENLDATSSTTLKIGSANATKIEIGDTDVLTEIKGDLCNNNIDACQATTLTLGASTATKVELADTGITTEIQGPLALQSNLVFDQTNDLTLSASTQTSSAVTLTIPDLAGSSQSVAVTDVVQTLTNKTITDTSSTTRADRIATTGSSVVISSTAPSSGQALIATSTTTAEWQTMVFGTEFEQSIASSVTNTTVDVNTGGDGTYTTHLSLTTATKPVGTYRIGWYYEFNYNATDANDFVGRVQVDGTSIHENVYEPSDSGGTPGDHDGQTGISGSGTNQVFARSGFHYNIRGTSGTYTITIQHGAGDGGTTSSMKNGRIEIWRVA